MKQKRKLNAWINHVRETQVFKYKDGSTTGLKNHLKSFHQASYAEFTFLTEQKNSSI